MFRKAIRMSIRARMPGFNVMRQRKNHRLCLLIQVGFEPQERFDVAWSIPQRRRRVPEIRSAFFASFDQFRRSEPRGNQNNRRRLIERLCSIYGLVQRLDWLRPPLPASEGSYLLFLGTARTGVAARLGLNAH